MAALQCDYVSEGKRVATELRERVHPTTLRFAAFGVGAAALLVVGFVFVAFAGPRPLSGWALLEGLGVIVGVVSVLAFVTVRARRRAAARALGELERSPPMFSFMGPSDGFTFFTPDGFFREQSLSFVAYGAYEFRTLNVRYDAANHSLYFTGTVPVQRHTRLRSSLSIALPRGVSLAEAQELARVATQSAILKR